MLSRMPNWNRRANALVDGMLGSFGLDVTPEPATEALPAASLAAAR